MWSPLSLFAGHLRSESSRAAKIRRSSDARASDDGRQIFFKGRDEAGRASIWSVPIDGGQPTLRVHFTDDERPSSRGTFDVGAGRLFFTTEERESEVWVAGLVR